MTGILDKGQFYASLPPAFSFNKSLFSNAKRMEMLSQIFSSFKMMLLK